MFLEQLLESLSLFTNKKYNIFLSFQNLNRGMSLLLSPVEKESLKKRILALKRFSKEKFLTSERKKMKKVKWQNLGKERMGLRLNFLKALKMLSLSIFIFNPKQTNLKMFRDTMTNTYGYSNSV